MTALALALVVGSAFAHATWNFLGKSSRDSFVFLWALSACGSLAYLPLVIRAIAGLARPTAIIPYVVGTMVLHTLYFNLLAAAYNRGDLSVVYPVARGTGLALIPIGGVLLLGERVSATGVASIVLIVLGVAVAHVRPGPAFSSVVRSLGGAGSLLAVLTGLVIATYSVWDKNALAVVPPIVEDYGGFVGQALLVAPIIISSRGPALRREIAERPLRIIAAGILAPLAYLMVLTALTFSRVSYVGPAREIGIVIGTLLGIFVLKEPHGVNRLVGASLIVAGVVGLAVS